MKNNLTQPNSVIAIRKMLAVTGTLAIIGGSIYTGYEYIQVQQSSPVQAQLKYNDRRIDPNGTQTSYYPVFEYQTISGPKEWHSRHASVPPKYQPGDTVTLLVNNTTMEPFAIQSFNELWLDNIIMIAVATASIVASKLLKKIS